MAENKVIRIAPIQEMFILHQNAPVVVSGYGIFILYMLRQQNRYYNTLLTINVLKQDIRLNVAKIISKLFYYKDIFLIFALRG